MGHNEIGDADDAEYGLSEDIAALFRGVGLPVPDKIPLMLLHHQIAQKLHGASEPDSKRPHDLIDLQIITQNSCLDLPKIKTACIRLFSYRKMQKWPPIIVKNEGWDSLYASQAKDLNVLHSVDDAVIWVNEFIHTIDAA